MRLDSALKKSSPVYLGPTNLDTFWCTGWAWNCQIIFRCASIHGRAGFILLIFFNLLNLFWHTDKNFCFYTEVNFWDFVRNDNSNKGTTARLNETRFGPKKVVPNISRPKKSRHFLMKLSHNFQMSEHSWPCWFHIKGNLCVYCK